MPNVPGLRSCYALVGRIVYFGRMLDKIRLHAAGRLPADYIPNIGKGFDRRCGDFLRVDYASLCTHTLTQKPSDRAVLDWAEAQGGRRTDDECDIWNGFMMKRGWRDEAITILRKRIKEGGLEDKPISTMFDFLEFDEGRDPIASRAWELRAPMVIVVMGVAGCGKTTVGRPLATTLGWSFRDADEFHPAANVAKMSAGLPLDDADRTPWLAAIQTYINETLANGISAVVTCSALKEAYRQAVIPPGANVKLVHLTGSFDLIMERISQRKGHFMKPDLLRSQFEALEAPKDALVIDVTPTPDVIVAEIRRALSL